MGMKSFLIKFSTLTVMLLGLPLLGVALSGAPVSRYLEFPPKTQYTQHAPFSWWSFTLYSILIVALASPLILRGLHAPRPSRRHNTESYPFPWWGWLGTGIGIFFWILAWNRFPWFSSFQSYTFTPLWISLILVVNAITYRTRGRCILLDRTRYFLLLFPASAAFWWFFEYLNRFVQNWYYSVPHYSSWEYFLSATLPFSTVLPAVLSIRDWVLGWWRIQTGFVDFLPLRPSHPKALAVAAFTASAAGLTAIGVYPNYFFSLLWVSPLLIIISLQTVFGERHALSGIAAGDWRLAVSSALAGLICGWFWEMWNYYSLARWEYSVPFVHRFKLFEMPILGYAGYFPFGLECAVVADLLDHSERDRKPK